MTWEQFHEEHKVWLASQFPCEPPLITALGIMEEIGEVCRALLKQDQMFRHGIEPRYKDVDWNIKLRDSVADTTIYFSSFCVSKNLPFVNFISRRYTIPKFTTHQALSALCVTGAKILYATTWEEEPPGLSTLSLQLHALALSLNEDLFGLTWQTWQEVKQRRKPCI